MAPSKGFAIIAQGQGPKKARMGAGQGNRIMSKLSFWTEWRI